ncbi:MAG: MFS transporter [Bacteroidota bacterium]
MTLENRNAFAYATIVAMGGLIFGLDAALISGTLNFVAEEFGLSDLQIGSVVSAPAFGVLVALPFAGYISNQLGRKKTIQIIALLYVVSAVGSALAPSFTALVSARFLGGLAFSSLSMASMYIGEIAPPAYRGKLVAMIQINIVIGLSGAYFINYLILQWTQSEAGWVEALSLDEHTWRWMLGSEILPAIAWFALLLIVPESPSWLLLRGRNKEARTILQRILPQEEIEPHMEEMQGSLRQSNEDRSIRAQLAEIFSRPMRVTLIIAMTLAIAQQTTGINAVLFYAPSVFEQLGIGTDAAFQQAIWIGLSSLVFTALSLVLVDRFGRKPMILWGMVWIVASLGLCSYGFYSARYVLSEADIYGMTEIPEFHRMFEMAGVEYGNDADFKDALIAALGEADARRFRGAIFEKAAKINPVLILVGILSFIGAFHFSVGPIMWVLFSELFPIAIRGVAIPFYTLVTSLTSSLVQQFFPWQLATLGGAGTFLFYALTVLIGLLILMRFLVETKNLSIEEIQRKLILRSSSNA